MYAQVAGGADDGGGAGVHPAAEPVTRHRAPQLDVDRVGGPLPAARPALFLRGCTARRSRQSRPMNAVSSLSQRFLFVVRWNRTRVLLAIHGSY